jgi:hypothetical protein
LFARGCVLAFERVFFDGERFFGVKGGLESIRTAGNGLVICGGFGWAIERLIGAEKEKEKSGFYMIEKYERLFPK